MSCPVFRKYRLYVFPEGETSPDTAVYARKLIINLSAASTGIKHSRCRQRDMLYSGRAFVCFPVYMYNAVHGE